MKKDVIKEIVRNNCDRIKFNSGFTAYKNNLVLNNYSSEENGVVTFYAMVKDQYHNQHYTSLVTVDESKRVIVNMSCDCSESISKKNKIQICSHMVATVFNNLDNEIETSYIEANGSVINCDVKMNFTQSRNGYIGVDFELDGIDKIEYRRIFNSYKEKKKLHRLSDGNLIELTDENLVKAFEIIDLAGAYNDFEKIKIPNNKSLFLEHIIENVNFVSGTKYIKNISKKYNKISKSTYEVPPTLNAKLRDYQIEGFRYLKSIFEYGFGAILADDMGLGKTIQTIAFLLSLENKKSIVIVPTSLIYNWKIEFEKFAPGLNIGFIYGDKLKREETIKNIESYNVILTTYGTLKNDIKLYEEVNFDVCVIDEAQNIKNSDAAVTKLVKEIKSNVKIALTGTPIENNVAEIWSIFDFIMPGYLYNKKKFLNIFNSHSNIQKLKDLIAPFMLRRTKEEVLLELPKKIEQTLYVDMNRGHKIAYNSYLKLIKDKVKIGQLDNMTILSYLTKLRQLTLVPESMVKNYKGENTKLEVLTGIIKDNSDKKILVFSQFTKVLKVIEGRLDSEGISYSYLDGKTKTNNRVKLVEEFNESEEKRVFLISLKAGGTGLNLTSASVVVHYDPWWNPAVENQASDRAHRMGQKNVVNVIKLIAKESVEERVLALQEEKKDIIEDLIEGNANTNNSLNKLSKDEILDLFI